MSAPSLKNRKPPVYVFLTVYSLCCAFFLIESAFPGDLSSEQSGAVSDVIAFFANLFKDTTVGSSRVDLQACKLEYSIVSPK